MNTCGLGQFFHPAWLQRFATARCFLVVYGLLGTIQSMSYIYFVATLTTLEKRFKIPSRTTGFMISGNEISQVLLSLLLSYYGGQRNRPVWIAWGVAFSGVSCFILAVPHFLYGPGSTALSLTKEYIGNNNLNSSVFTSKDDAMLCTSDSRVSTICNAKDTIGEFSSVPPLVVFFSQFVLGIGTTLYFALGQTYIDDNTKKKNTPILLGLTLSLRTIGPAFGFIIGYFCLKIYIDPTLTPIIDNKDPRWLGAWWLGWLLLGTTMVLFSLLISLFPKKLPPKKSQVDIIRNGDCTGVTEQDEHKKQQINNSNLTQIEKMQIHEEKPKAPTLKEFPSALARLLKNKLLIVNILSGVFYILGGSGYITYITKYLEIQFQASAADASFIIGPTTILSMTLGFLGSGIIISKFRPKPTTLLSWNVLVGISFVIGEISFIFISCSSNSLMGYGTSSKRIEIFNECNNACNCQGVKYNPVCLESEAVIFFSACHAGCSSQKSIGNSKMVYNNCSCIYPQIVELKIPKENIEDEKHKYQHYSDPHVTLESGPCKNNCFSSFVIFISITCIMHFLGSSGKIGNILVNYRCVDEVDKSFAQGLSLLLISLFALIPGPILYGFIIDTTCIIWDETCGERGNCWLYNRDDFRFNLNVTAAVMTSIGAVLDGVVCYLGRNLDLYSDNESNENTTKCPDKTTDS
ncbi:organic anion transporting polypeptide 33Ea [Lycorma delicatula]|uniref:organic anion transporting polypeptide 33Ea n=1 Tax=Lycorma delicatula TaxID=130591 RepID=UPI003F516918